MSGPSSTGPAGTGRPAPAALRQQRAQALRARAVALVEQHQLAQPRAAWRIVALDAPPGNSGPLRVGGFGLDARALVPATGRLTALAFGAATMGPRIDEWIGRLVSERRPTLALALDSLANELLLALVRRVQDRVCAEARRQGCTVAGELCAGDPGLELQAQHVVLELAGAAAIDLTLSRTLMMRPIKSSSFVLGVGPDLPATSFSRCDACRSRERCGLRHARAMA